MPYTSPTPPKELSTATIEQLDDLPPGLLRHVAHYAKELAEHREREARLAEENDSKEIEDRPEELPDDVPSKATITIKEINDNRYYYWQWRDGDQIRSQYKGPVNPEE